MNIKKEIKKIEPYLIRTRRYLHQHPELGQEEKETAGLVVRELKKMGIPCRQKVGGYGVVGLIKGGKRGKCIALRADMDALPIQEETSLAFKSKMPGKMHACGHDAHVAILLATARILNKYKNHLKGSIKLLFQPSEEKHPGGALPMIKDGVLKNPKVDAALALHVVSTLPAGKIGIREGTVFSQPDEFIIVIKGKSGHASRPQVAIDSVVTAAQVIVALQTVVSRRTDPLKPAVLSVCMVSGGTAYNVLPETVTLGGTVRTFDPKLARSIKRHMRQIIRGITNAAGATFGFTYMPGYPVGINHPGLCRLVRTSTISLYGKRQAVEQTEPSTGGEDFAYFQQRVPAMMFRLGVGGRASNALHNARFNLNEKGLGFGVGVFVKSVVNYLND